MKTLIIIDLIFIYLVEDEDDEDLDRTHRIGSRRFNSFNEEDLNNVNIYIYGK